MQTLTDLAQFVTFHNEAVQENLWEWFSAQVYGRILESEQDSLIVRVRQRFNLNKVVKACEGYRQYEGGVGQEAEYPVLRLCWALLLRYLCGWSLRMLECELRVNLLVRWCTHFALQEQTPDHTTLWRFENWMREHALDVMFVTVLGQIDEDFPDDAHELQCGDTFGVWAKVADISLNTLVRRSCRRLLVALEAALPLVYAGCIAQLDLTALFGPDDERPERLLSPAEREERTLKTAQAAADCLAVVQPVVPACPGSETEAAALAELQKWCGAVMKILADEFTDKPLPPPKPSKRKATPGEATATGEDSAIQEAPSTAHETTPEAPGSASVPPGSEATAPATPPALPPVAPSTAPVAPTTPVYGLAGDVTQAMPAAPSTAPVAPTTPAPLRRCIDEERGSYRIISDTDTDATVRKHGESIILGYNAAVLGTANFVRGIDAYTGATPDGVTVAPSLAQHQDRFGFCPERFVYDRAAGTPKHIADVRHASDGKTQLVARQINYARRHTRFGPTDFTLGPLGLTCPNGVVSTRAYRAGGSDGFDYRFLANQCQGCPLWDRCRDPKSKPSSHRTVFISDYALLYKEELAYLDTEAAKADFAFRANIERHIAALTLHNGARHANAIGLRNVNFQLTMSATAYDLKRWHTLTLEQERKGLKEKPSCPTSLYPPT